MEAEQVELLEAQLPALAEAAAAATPLEKLAADAATRLATASGPQRRRGRAGREVRRPRSRGFHGPALARRTLSARRSDRQRHGAALLGLSRRAAARNRMARWAISTSCITAARPAACRSTAWRSTAAGRRSDPRRRRAQRPQAQGVHEPQLSRAAGSGALLKQFGDPRLVGASLPLFVVIGPGLKRSLHYHVGHYDVHQDQGLKELDDVGQPRHSNGSKCDRLSGKAVATRRQSTTRRCA